MTQLTKDWNGSSQLFQLIVRDGGLAPIPYTYSGPLKELNAHSKYTFSSKLGHDRLLWNSQNKIYSHQILEDLGRHNWRGYNPTTKNKTLNHEYMILRDKLIIYEKFCKSLNIIPEDTTKILKNNLSLGPLYAVKRKKIFDYSIRETIAENQLKTPEDVPTIDLTEGINKFFPSRHMINWEIPVDYSDILEYSFENPKINDHSLTPLELTMEKFL
jgi:hypothetical protein